MIRAEVIESDAGLGRLEPAWWDLWRRCPEAHPFGSPAWLLPWWEAFRPGRLATIAAWSGSDLVGLLPAWLEEGPHGRRLLPLGIGLTDYLDPLFDNATLGEAWGAVSEAACGLGDSWQRWELEELSAHASVLVTPCPAGLGDHHAEQSAAPVLALTAAKSDVPARKRRKLRMSRHRVERRGGIVRAPSPDEAASFMGHLERLHGARWSERGESGVLADAPVQRFHELALPRLAAEGLVRLFLLEFGAEVAGAYYGLSHRDRAYAYVGGFDPAFAFESPGTVLVGQAIEAARQEGVREFHFLRGQEPYKYEWGALDRWTRRRTFIRLADA